MSKTRFVLAAVLLAGFGAWIAQTRSGVEAASQNSGPASAAAVPVKAGTAEARDMPVFVRGIGSVQAFNTVTIKSRVDGQVMKVDFTEGQEVKAGDLLFEIDPRPFQAALAQATANKQKDEAQLVSATADLDRTTQLLRKEFQTRQTFDQQKAQVGQLQASIKADQAQIDAAQLNLDYASIRSPIDGRTGARLVDVGNIVHAVDNTGLVTITQLRPIFVSFTVPQQQLDTIRERQSAGPLEARALTQDDQKQLAVGKLTLIDNQVDQATGTLHMKAQFDNTDAALWPGEFVNVRLVASIEKNAVTVPARAVQQGPNGSYLFAIKPDDTVEMRIVEVSQTDQGLAVIKKGLQAGERIVVDGQFRLDQGTKVAIQPAASSGG
ncbi:MAG TPA: efflux RND transporter periplasmic adaptor subunit [Stellaceae bacterium]|jgi:multidrug efflux system membrane fusion protein|nr:efflux RND transporter periplasmic adaptor subunit [Stellaceae bacterium]